MLYCYNCMSTIYDMSKSVQYDNKLFCDPECFIDAYKISETDNEVDEIKELENELNSKDEQIRDLETIVEDLEDTIRDLEHEIKEIKSND